VALSKYPRPRAARFQPGQYRNMSADWGRLEVAGRWSARREQPKADLGMATAQLL
jgi:hypothetical protein